MQLCTDKDIALLEPGLFLESGFSHLRVIRNTVVVVTGTNMVTSSGLLANVTAGMVGLLGLPGQLIEVVKIISTSNATISVLLASTSTTAISPGINGEIELSVLSFKPVIEYASQEILESIGAGNSSTDHQILVRQAAVSRTLSLLCMALAQGITPSSESAMNSGSKAKNEHWQNKSETYRKQWESLRRRLSLRVDQNGDGQPETTMRGNIINLWRM